MVRLLLEDGRADPSAANNAPMYVAIQNGHIEVVRLLRMDPRIDQGQYAEVMQRVVEANRPTLGLFM